MKINPICQRELRANGRSYRTALIITVFNAVLALVALTYMSYTLNQVRSTGEIQYSVFLTIFRYVAAIEFALIMLLMPAQTSGSISGEREKRTLDLILTTRLREKDIVTGKISAALLSVFLMVVSGAPIIALVFVYGGVTFGDLFLMFLSFFTAAFMTGSMGLWLSAQMKRTALATAASYGLETVLTFGTIGINLILKNLSAVSAGTLSLLLLSPLSTFYTAVSRVTGERTAAVVYAKSLNVPDPESSFLLLHWFPAGTAVQLLLGLLFLFLAVRALKPGKR